jgi:hypothetical protein
MITLVTAETTPCARQCSSCECHTSQVETLVAALKMIRDGSHSWSVDATDLAREALRKVGRAE